MKDHNSNCRLYNCLGGESGDPTQATDTAIAVQGDENEGTSYVQYLKYYAFNHTNFGK